jgi:hypothetical protein
MAHSSTFGRIIVPPSSCSSNPIIFELLHPKDEGTVILQTAGTAPSKHWEVLAQQHSGTSHNT